MSSRKPPLETRLLSHLPSRPKLPGNTNESVSIQFTMLLNSAGLEKAQRIKYKALNGNVVHGKRQYFQLKGQHLVSNKDTLKFKYHLQN